MNENQERIENKLNLMGDAAAEAFNANQPDLAMFTVAVGAVAMLAEIVQELAAIRTILENPASSLD